MASVTTAAGEIGLQPIDPGGQTASVPAAGTGPVERPAIERVGPVRILRGEGWRDRGWRGVALRLAPGHDEARFELALTAGDGRSVTVATMDRDDAVALWRSCGLASGLPLLLETEDGAVSEPYPQLGRVALGSVRIRRRHAALNGRRPRFLTRRKPSRLPDLPVVFRADALFD